MACINKQTKRRKREKSVNIGMKIFGMLMIFRRPVLDISRWLQGRVRQPNKTGSCSIRSPGCMKPQLSHALDHFHHVPPPPFSVAPHLTQRNGGGGGNLCSCHPADPIFSYLTLNFFTPGQKKKRRSAIEQTT